MRRPWSWLAAASVAIWALCSNVSPAFTPLRTELSNARGFSRGLLNLVVLPAATAFPRVHLAWIVGVGAALLLLLSCPPYRSRARWSIVWTLGPAVADAFLAAAVVSPLVTRYRIVYAPRTFALLSLALCAPRLTTAVPRGEHPVLAGRRRHAAGRRRRMYHRGGRVLCIDDAAGTGDVWR